MFRVVDRSYALVVTWQREPGVVERKRSFLLSPLAAVTEDGGN